MKKTIIAFACVIALASCSQKWEYKTVTVSGEKFETMEDFLPKTFDIPDSTLSALGNEGWELVDIYTQTETVHPNFGNSQYVTGIQPNVRTSEVNFVFKRKK